MAIELSPIEIKAYQDTFKMFDRNGDGKITAEEIKEVMKNCGLSASEGEIKQMIKEADKDKSGTIEWDEFVKAMTHTKRRMSISDQQYEDTFKLFDSDGDGYITKQELTDAVEQLGLAYVYTPEVIRQMFLVADIDKDGKISRNEYLDAMRKGL